MNDYIQKCDEMELDNHLNAFIESYIREHQFHVNWTIVCEYQHFSIDFMRQMRDKIDWETLMCSSVNEDLPRKFIDELGFEYWEHPNGTLFIDVPDKNKKIKHITAKIKLY